MVDRHFWRHEPFKSRRSPELKTVLKQIFCIANLKKNRVEILEDFSVSNDLNVNCLDSVDNIIWMFTVSV